jgi:hypothetical protein
MNSIELKITQAISAETLAGLVLDSFLSLPEDTKELLLQSKNEQTFSALVAARIQRESSLENGSSLVEIKGTDYSTRGTKTKNFHDIAIVNPLGKAEIIIENKVWYHFDGAKGKRAAKVEPGIGSQLDADISKIKLTLKDLAPGARGFILMHIVTPAGIDSIPTSYLKSHKAAFARVNSDWNQYLKEGLEGIAGTLEGRSKAFGSGVVIKSASVNQGKKQGFINIVCVEVKA